MKHSEENYQLKYYESDLIPNLQIHIYQFKLMKIINISIGTAVMYISLW